MIETDTRAQVNATAIRKLKVRFTAGKDLKAALQKAQFVPAENMTGSEERKYSFGTESFVGKYEHNYNRTITISEEGDQTTTRCRRGNPTVVNGSGKIAS